MANLLVLAFSDELHALIMCNSLLNAISILLYTFSVIVRSLLFWIPTICCGISNSIDYFYNEAVLCCPELEEDIRYWVLLLVVW